MKNLFFILVLVLAATVVAEGTSYTSMGILTQSGSEAIIHVRHMEDTDALDFYTDLATFQAANPGLTPEDYSATLLPANAVQSDTGLLLQQLPFRT